MEFIIRKMIASDKDEVIKMMKVFYESDAVLSNGSVEIFENDFNSATNNSPFLEGYIFESNNQIIGYSLLAKSFSTEYGLPCIWIEDLYLKLEFRSKGIGSNFFRYIEKEYPNTLLKLEVERENIKALNMYKKNGYEPLEYLEMIKINK